MIIAILGRGGTGKSMLCDMLGVLFSKKGPAAVIDTDLTQPTLPIRLPGRIISREDSLGKSLSGAGSAEINRYLKQHPKHKSLFFAGLTDGDDCLSYELGLEAAETVHNFVNRCGQTVDHVILDCSSQRTDPFLPVALTHADHIVLLITPDIQGVCWYLSIRPLLESMDAMNRVFPVLTRVQRYHAVGEALKMMSISNESLVGELPFAPELDVLRGSGQLPDQAITPAAIRWQKQAGQIFDRLTHSKGDPS